MRPLLLSFLALLLAAPAFAQPLPTPTDPPSQPGWIGVMLDTEADVARVTRAVMGGPAHSSGVRAGDVITGLDGELVGDARDLVRRISVFGAGDDVLVTLLRGASTIDVRLTLAPRPDPRQLSNTLLGAPFPFHPVTRVDDGADVTLRAEAPVTLVEFWATWCGPCRIAAPYVEAVRERWPEHVVAIAAVSSEDVETVAAWVDANGAPSWPLYADPSGEAEGAALVGSLPTWFVIGEHGNVRAVVSGADGVRQLETVVERLLIEQAGAEGDGTAPAPPDAAAPSPGPDPVSAPARTPARGDVGAPSGDDPAPTDTDDGR